MTALPMIVGRVARMKSASVPLGLDLGMKSAPRIGKWRITVPRVGRIGRPIRPCPIGTLIGRTVRGRMAVRNGCPILRPMSKTESARLRTWVGWVSVNGRIRTGVEVAGNPVRSRGFGDQPIPPRARCHVSWPSSRHQSWLHTGQYATAGGGRAASPPLRAIW
jgi:hypothetical protein